MHLSKHDIPTRLEAPGVVVRVLPDFGVADGPLGAEFFSLAAGTDIAPLLVGLEDDACQSEHWGYVLSGTAVATYSDGSTERCTAGEVFHWPAGHSIRIEEDAELIMFSPPLHETVIDHLGAAMSAPA